MAEMLVVVVLVVVVAEVLVVVVVVVVEVVVVDADVDECVEQIDGCQQDSEVCRNTAGAYECDPRCDLGFRLSPTTRVCEGE